MRYFFSFVECILVGQQFQEHPNVILSQVEDINASIFQVIVPALQVVIPKKSPQHVESTYRYRKFETLKMKRYTKNIPMYVLTHVESAFYRREVRDFQLLMKIWNRGSSYFVKKYKELFVKEFECTVYANLYCKLSIFLFLGQIARLI